MKIYIIVVAGSLGLSACAGGLIPEKDTSSATESYRRQAQEYVNSHSIDKYWREWEYNQQYKNCMANKADLRLNYFVVGLLT